MHYKDNPLSLVYNALWELLLSSAEFTKLVRLSNRITFMGDNRDPIKQEVQTHDLPEVRLIPVSSTPHIQSTSNSSFLTERYEIQVSTGDQRIDAIFIPVKWAVYCAMSNWYSILRALTWKEKQFVTIGRPTGTTEGASKNDLTRGIVGWSSIWSCEVQMCFATSDLLGELK